MYRSSTITPLLRRSIVGLGLVVLLPSCTLTESPTPKAITATEAASREAITAAVVQPSTPAPELGALVETTQAVRAEHKLAWEGLIIQVPAQASFYPMPEVSAPATNGLPLIAAGAINYFAPPDDGAIWNGPSFMIFEFEGTAEDWVDLERQGEPPQSFGSPPITVLEESVRPHTIAGKQGLAYQFDMPPQNGKILENYALKLDDQRLLVIGTQDIQNPTFQSVINTLQLQ